MNPPRSPSLEPPRKSVELEDPGAHELSGSEDEHFSDAQEDRHSTSRPTSPIPITRVEKVDDRENYGEVPGTDAYRMREQDAVPDELEIIPDEVRGRSGPGKPPSPSPKSPTSPIPKTIVEKIDPLSPSYGEVPGTPAHSKRQADAVPDLVRPVSSDRNKAFRGDESRPSPPTSPIPTTIVTKVDSNPSHGEVPGTEAHEKRRGDALPDVVEKKGDVKSLRHRSAGKPLDSASPIAADGGFGPMLTDESSEEDAENEPEPHEDAVKEISEHEDGAADDFDDFEAGAEDDDFGDFDEGDPAEEGEEDEEDEEDQTETVTPSIQPSAPIDSPFPLLDFSDLDTHEEIQSAMQEHLDALFPATTKDYPPPPALTSDPNSIFLTERSLSLWTQLVAPPPLQPPNWVRSRIRRLFLVSLGVPVDLDEILPASKQKKLVLPSTNLTRSRSQSPPTDSSKTRLKQQQHDNESSTSLEKTSHSGRTSSRRKKGAAATGGPPKPDIDLQATKLLCATTEAALSNMTDDELKSHVRRLEELTTKASEALEYWLKRRDSALGDKEAFEGVIENLVKHARRVRS